MLLTALSNFLPELIGYFRGDKASLQLIRTVVLKSTASVISFNFFSSGFSSESEKIEQVNWENP